MYSNDMKLTQQQIEEAYGEVTVGHREPLGTIVRMKGDKEDYKKLSDMLWSRGWH